MFSVRLCPEHARDAGRALADMGGSRCRLSAHIDRLPIESAYRDWPIAEVGPDRHPAKVPIRSSRLVLSESANVPWPKSRAQRRLAAILAIDVVGYSRLMERDEVSALAMLKSRRSEILQPMISKHHGRIIKLMGDGVLIEFGSAVNAVDCAVELQTAMDIANNDLAVDRRIVLRAGINLGDVMVEGSDLYGDGVNIAARLESLSEPGGLCISGSVFEHVNGKLPHSFVSLGPQSLKNIDRLIHIYQLAGKDGPGAVIPAAELPLPDRPSIVVLPFVNMSGDAEQEYFVDGLTEDLITDLSKVPALFVIARNSSFSYKGRAVDVRQIARELGVKYVLEGSARRAGGRVRINAQLIDARAGGHIWADRFDRDLTEILPRL